MASPKLLEKTSSGTRLDRYELIGELASGGMATVFLARLPGVAGFQRMFAIKRLHPHLSNEQEFVEMFLDEARLAARIHHPHVVPILEIGTSDAGYYVVMEFIEGDSLAKLVSKKLSKGGLLPPGVALRIGIDALLGLHAAHELQDEYGQPTHLVHRDVSPQNILVGVDGSARITDFGVARASSRLSATRSGQLKGKLAYMAPEQARGGDLDRRADVFAMGIVLWEALSGRRLFKAENEMATLNRVLFEPIPRLLDVEPSIPEAIDEVIMRSLDRDPDKRYSTAAEFADAVESASFGVLRLASVRDVAGFVQEVLGDDIAQSRDVVRTWMTQNEMAPTSRAISSASGSYVLSTQTPSNSPPVSITAASMAVPEATKKLSKPTEERKKRKNVRVIAFVGAFLISISLGFVGFVFFGPSSGKGSNAAATAAQPAASVIKPVAADSAPAASTTTAAPAVSSAPAAIDIASLPADDPGAGKVAGQAKGPAGGGKKPEKKDKPDTKTAPTTDDKYVNPYRLSTCRQHNEPPLNRLSRWLRHSTQYVVLFCSSPFAIRFFDGCYRQKIEELVHNVV